MHKSKNIDINKDSIKFNHKKAIYNENKNKNYSQTTPLLNPTDHEKLMTPSNSNVLKNATTNVFFGEMQKGSGLNMTKSSNNNSSSNNLTNLIKNFDNNNNNNNKTNNNLPNSFQPNNKSNQFYKSDSSEAKADNYPSLVTPQVGLNSGNSDDGFNNKQMINLEDVCMLEEKLWKILECLRLNANVGVACEEWLDTLNLSSIQNIENYFQNVDTRREIKISSIIEILSVVCVLCLIYKFRISYQVVSNLKNLFYNLHQNFLLVINLFLNRIPKSNLNNIWVVKLNTLVINKQIKTIEGEDLFLLGQSNQIISNIIKNLINTNFKSQNDSNVLLTFSDIQQNFDKYTYQHVKGVIYNLKNSEHANFNAINQNNIIFQNIPAPYLPPIDRKKHTYTVVLDLDETLVHFVNNSDGGELQIRPGAEKFLKEIANYYEVVVFTAALQDYADWILDSLDQEKNLISYRLYRQHASINKNTYVKDISKLGRDLSKTIIIDNVWENFQLQPSNGIFIKTWLEDQNDTCLLDLLPLLKDIVNNKVEDLRKTLRKFRDVMIRLYVKGDNNPYETLRKYFESENKSNENI